MTLPKVAGAAVFVVAVVAAGALKGAGAALLVGGVVLLTLWNPAGGFAVFLPLMLLDRFDPNALLGGSLVRLEEIAVWGFIGAVFARRLAVPGNWRVLWWAAPLLVVASISNIANLPLHQALPYALRDTLFPWAVWAGSVVIADHRDWRLVRGGLLAAGAALVAGAALQLAIAPTARITGGFVTPTALAAASGLLAPIMFAIGLAARDRRHRRLGLAGAGLIVLASLVSLTRLGMMATAAGIGIVGLMHYLRGKSARIRRRAVAAVMVTILAGLGLGAWTVARYAAVPLPQEETGYSFRRLSPAIAVRHLLDLRLPIWDVGWSMWQDHPVLGIGGPSQYRRQAALYDDVANEYSEQIARYPLEVERAPWRTNAHQLWLQIAVQWGALGLASFAVFVGLLVGGLVRAAPASLLARGCLGALVALLVHNLFDYTLLAIAGEAGLLIGLGLRHGSK